MKTRACHTATARRRESVFLRLRPAIYNSRVYGALQGLLERLGLSSPPSINYIGGSEVLPPPLSREDEERAINGLSAGDEGAKRLLIEHNLRLVVYISRRFENTGVGLEDLISIGTIGLIKAINTFNAEKKIQLATYASRCVENEILMHLRKISSHKSEVSLDEPLNTDWDGNELLLSDVLGTDGDEISRPMEDDADRRMLMDAVYSLGERERAIIVMRFGLGGSSEYTQKEVADIMGISQSYISRLEKRIISRLKREIIRQSY
jgi:RNA polymerase sporulation-specific sigma factor